ncbi:MAG: sensor domain-containing diguanylate cyclase [Treponema sp.]|jgi:diguanylate cyclase (GGDEF)-like protein|nr:sensor domain-containing diguanylate cyclase [Treponema sp.]
MNTIENLEGEYDLLSNPQIMKYYSLLQNIGVFKHIELINKELKNYKNLLSGARDIFNRTTIDEIIDAAVRQISDHLLPSFIVFLWKPLQSRNDITIRSYRNYKPVDIGINITSITPFEAFFRQYSRPVNLDKLITELNDESIIETLNKVRPELIIPILGPSGLYGLIMVGCKILGEVYTQNELVFIENLMSFVSQAIQNHLHYEQTLRDPKTGLFNHTFFMARLSEEIARSRRSKFSSTVIVMDVDKFKNFNDSYGHLAGDTVLENISFVIKQAVRSVDIPSRFGGEEFTVLLPDTGKEIAWGVAERIRTAVAEAIVPWNTPLPQVTISLGVFTFNCNEVLTASEILTRADEALYQSKEGGRNRTTVWDDALFPNIEPVQE